MAAFRHKVGWVKRDVGTIYVGFAYFCASQKFEIATKLANPTNLIVDRWLNPTYDPSFRPRSGYLRIEFFHFLNYTIGNFQLIHFICVNPCSILEKINSYQRLINGKSTFRERRTDHG